MYDSASLAEEEQWVIWNGTLGIVDMVTIGRVETAANGVNAWLDEPYDMVGPISFDELEASGWISFAACVVMSRQKWQEDQVELRQAAHKSRRAAQEQLFEEYTAYQESRSRRPTQVEKFDEKQHRQTLQLPIHGKLEPSQIKASYRRLAQKAHPDAGGSHEQFVQITGARDALLERFS